MSDIFSLQNEINAVQSTITSAKKQIADLKSRSERMERNIKSTAATLGEKLKGMVDEDSFKEFIRHPWVMVDDPDDENSRLVLVPKFVKGIEPGWLIREESAYYIYRINHYACWFGNVPQSILEEVQIEQTFDAQISGNQIFYDESERDVIRREIGEHLADIEATQARVKRGHEFSIIVDMIKSGFLPFKERAVDSSDLRDPRSPLELRDYQEKAVNEFMRYGSVGLFHPTGSGKTFISLHLCDRIKGKKLILVPSRTLVDQWAWRIADRQDGLLPHCINEIDIKTYQGYRQNDEEYSLVVFDECHRLPADTFSRVNFVNAKYRIGLSASPFREDGREEYIFALTGHPIGLNWREYMEREGREYHPVFVHLISNRSGSKMKKVKSLIDWRGPGKTLIFCDSIEMGNSASRELGIPHIHGNTRDRLETIRNNDVFVGSRVLDEGVSIDNLRHIIEIDFLYGSKRQEIQRSGRLMHSKLPGLRHDILMTHNEYAQYENRLWALTNMGFDVKVEE